MIDDFTLRMERVSRRIGLTIAALEVETSNDDDRQRAIDELHDLKGEVEEISGLIQINWPGARSDVQEVELEGL